MAVTNEQLLYQITVQNDQAISSLEEIKTQLKGLDKSFSKTEKAVDDFGARFTKMAVVAYAAIASIKAVGTAVEGLIAPFVEAQDAATKLRHALEISGSTSVTETIANFTALGDSLEALGVATTEQVLALAKFGITAGQSTEQVEKLIKAAADLSVARDIPMETAFKALSASLKGSSGALSNFLPELKNLTEEQNKSGMAIDYVTAALGGTASKNLETYVGKIAVLNSRVGDLGESLGEIAAKILDLDTSVQTSTSYIESWNNTLNQNKQTLITIGKIIAAPFIHVAKVISDLAISAGGAFGFLELTIGGLILAFGKLQVWTDKLAGRSTAMGDAIISTGQAMVDSGKAMTKAAREMLTPVDVIEKLPPALDATAKAGEKAASALEEINKQIMTQEQIQAWDTLKAKVIELQKAMAVAGKEGADLIRSKAAADREEINALIEKLKLGRQLTTEQLAAAEKARSFINQGEQAAIDKLHSESLTKILEKNREIEISIKSIDATRREQIQYQLDSELRLLEIERQRIDQADKASLEAIDRQKELLKMRAKKQADSGPSEGFERIAKIGNDAAKQISGVFSTGAMGMVGGAVSMVGAVVQAVDAMLDFFPNLINSIAGVFNKLTDFPETLFNAFQGMFDAIVRFVGEFIPKLVESIFKSLTQIKDFVNNFANALTGLADALPDIIAGLIERLPEILWSLIENLAKAWLKILAAIYIKIPIAILKGIFQGLSKLWEGIKRLMSGKSFLPKIKVDEKSVANLTKKIGGSAGRIFSVKDMLDAAKDPMDKVTEGIQNAFKKGGDWIKQAWMWVYDKILKPIMDGLKAVWMWIYDNIIMPIARVLTEAWRWINDTIVQPIIDAFQAVFEFLNDKVLKPAMQGLTRLFTWINDKIFQPLINGVEKVFGWIFDMFGQIWGGLTTAVSEAFGFLKGIGETIAEPIKNAFAGIGDFFKNIGKAFESLFKFDFNGFAKSMGDALMSVLNPIFDILKVPVNAIIDFINSLKLPGFEVGFSVLGKKVSFGWGETDLVPGDIQRLASGGLVTGTGLGLSGFGTDTVPIAATPGEFIVNRRGVETAGLDMLGMINRGIAPQGGGATYNIEFEINIDAKTPMDEGFIRGKLVPAMRDELKRASLDGQFVISQRGIR